MALITKYDLPVPIINFNLRRKQPDAYFPEHNLIVELDGWAFHNDRESFETDREMQRLEEILEWLQNR